jgi:protein SCO1/2
MLIAAVVLAGVLAGIAAAFVLKERNEAPPELERATMFETPRPLADFALVDQAGRAFDLDRLRGRWTLLFFGFTHCPDICPMTLAELAEVRRALADLPPAQHPVVVLVTVDPLRDTPDVMARYVRHFDPEFQGATGTPGAIEALTRELGVAVMMGAPAADGSYTVDHSAAVFVMSPAAEYTAVFGTPHDADTIARDFRRIVAARTR